MEKFLPLVNREYCCKIWIRDILYIEQTGRTVNIVTENKTFYDYNKIKNLELYLDEYFVHCLKGTVVNFDQIESMKDQCIIFKNGTKYLLGRQSFVHTKQTFVFYMKNTELFLERRRKKIHSKFECMPEDEKNKQA